MQGLTQIPAIPKRDTAERWARAPVRHEPIPLQMYLDVTEALLVALDHVGCITRVNKKACDVLGYAESELLGRDWFAHFLPERDQEAVRQVFQALMAGDVEAVGQYENAVRTRSGEERMIRWHNAVLHDRHGAISGTLSSGEDVTERRALERKVLRISEEERQRIGQDIHDSLASQFSGIALLSRGLVNQAEQQQPLSLDVLEEIALLARTGAEQARALARGLNPVKLGREGLQAALKEMMHHAEMLSGMACTLDFDDALPPLKIEVATQFYRIAQEAVTNAIKHAGATRLWLRLRRHGGRLLLSVRDDGAGLTKDAHDGDGMGLHIMPYRARMLGATLRIDSVPERGTTIRCSMPLDEAHPDAETHSSDTR